MPIPPRPSAAARLLLVLALALGALTLATIAPASAQAQAQSSVELRAFDAELRAAATAPEVSAMAHVLAANHLLSWIEPEHARASIRALIDAMDPARAPDAFALASYLLHDVVQATDDPDAVEASLHAQGFLRHVAVIGPFPNDGMSGFRQALGPEIDGVQLDRTYAGRNIPVAWRALDERMPWGFIDLSRVLAPAVASVAYVATEVDLDRPLDGALALAVDGAYRVWVDGVPVAEVSENLGGFAIRDRIPLRLPRGRTQIVIKIAVDEGPWGLHLRVLDANGAPVSVRHAAPTDAGPPLQAADVWPRAITLADRIRAAVDPAAADPVLAAHTAVVLRALHSADPARPWRPFVLRATSSADLAPPVIVSLASALDTAWEVEELLQRVGPAVDASSAPDLALLRAAHRRDALDAEGPIDARRILRDLLDRHPDALRAQVIDAEILRAEGLDLAWSRRMIELAERWPDVPALRRHAAEAAKDLLAFDAQTERLERALALHRSDAGLRVALADARLARGAADEALALLEEGLLRDPLSTYLHATVARVAEALDRPERAAAAWETVLAIRPGAADTREHRGRLLLADGLRTEALRYFRDALDRSPQNAVLRDLIRWLDDDRPRFWAPWALDDDRIRALAAADTPTGDLEATMLVDQKVTDVLPGGLANAWVQQAWLVHTRAGAESLRALGVTWTPDSELVDILRVRVIGADGRIRDTFSTSERGPGRGPSDIYYDVRSRIIYPPALEPGDVLIWEYTLSEVAYRNLFDDYFGAVWPLQGHQPRRFLRWVLLAPDDRAFFWNADTLPFGSVTETREDGRAIRVLEASNVPRVVREPGMPGWSESFAWLSVSTYADWDALASWYWDLVRDQLVPSPEIERTVQGLVDGVDDRRAHVAAIYQWVVRNIRYVGLEFGIHGYKPYRTTDCYGRRFGDCKDTASLLKVMLAAAGIESHLVLVRTSDLGRLPAFPPSLHVFNHAILYVPEFDLYLDGTAGFSGSSELPVMDQGASALVILDGRGGSFLTIPVDPADQNRFELTASFDLRTDVASGRVDLLRSGAFAPATRRAFENDDQRNARLERMLVSSFPGLTVRAADFSDMADTEAPVRIEATVESANLVQRAGARVTLRPLGERNELVRQLAGTSERRTPLRLDHPWRWTQRVTFLLPASWSRTDEPLPEGAVESVFGSAHLRTVLRSTDAGDELEIEARFSIEVTDIAVADYPSFRSFVAEAERLLEPIVRLRDASEAP